MEALVSLARERFGKVDALFANAGVMPAGNLSELKVEDWTAMVEVNIKGVLYAMAAVLPEMIAQRRGHVLVTSSVAGTRAVPGNAVYCGTKHFVRALLESFRAEAVQEGTNLRTTILYPGAVQTELLHTIAPLGDQDGGGGLLPGGGPSAGGHCGGGVLRPGPAGKCGRVRPGGASQQRTVPRAQAPGEMGGNHVYSLSYVCLPGWEDRRGLFFAALKPPLPWRPTGPFGRTTAARPSSTAPPPCWVALPTAPPACPRQGAPLPKEDSVNPQGQQVGQFVVSVDPKGSLAFSGPVLERKGRPAAHVIEAVTGRWTRPT